MWDYIIVQAGGKGTRLKHLTENKPKAIVSVNNLPIIFHLFRKYPESHFIIIGDYKKEVMDSYLQIFSEVKYLTVDTCGKKGTCSGIRKAIELVPPDKSFALIWSDLILSKDFQLPETNANYLGLSDTFECRWSYSNGCLMEQKSTTSGVAGLFLFEKKELLKDIPLEGEFVRWLSSQNIKFAPLWLKGSEYGLIERIVTPTSGKCRPFNSMKIDGNVLIKEGIDDQGRKLAVREKNWYRHIEHMDIPTPKIYSYEPFVMELIPGKNVFEYDIPEEEKKSVLRAIMEGLKKIHAHDQIYSDRFSMKSAYYDKTLMRMEKVRTLIPFSNCPEITINGKKCRNVFFHLDELYKKIEQISSPYFCLIHGDCTFSNIILDKKLNPIFIDPRGYFGHCELIGDPNYDWSKLYYSLYGDYDQFNLGNYHLSIKEDSVELNIKTNGWKCTESEFIKSLPKEIYFDDIRLIHALIWLSLTTYAWDNYDSICGAFYNGLYYLEEVL